MSGGHTAGPWSYRSQPHDDWGVVRSGRFWICQAKDPNVYTEDQLAAHRAAGTDPWEANARLIAAAPDLLEAVELIVVEANSAGAHLVYNAPVKGLSEAIYNARAAIAKAKGEA